MTTPRDGRGDAAMRAMGFDVSTVSSGVCVVERTSGSGLVRLLASTTIKRKLPAGTEALCTMADALRDLTKQYQLDRVAIEDLWVNRDPERGQAVALDLARLHGMVEYLLHRRGLRLERWAPAGWRKVAFGGNVPKVMVPKRVLQTYGFDAPDDHQADAFGVATATLIRAQGGTSSAKTSKQREPPREEATLF